jgi:hypothetical protein
VLGFDALGKEDKAPLESKGKQVVESEKDKAFLEMMYGRDRGSELRRARICQG